MKIKMENDAVAHMELLGTKWTPEPPDGFKRMRRSYLFQLGLLGYSLYSDEHEDLLALAHCPPGSTEAQQVMNFEGAAIQQQFLSSNSPAFFVDPALETVCSDGRAYHMKWIELHGVNFDK